MKKLLMISLFLASINLIYAENEKVTTTSTSSKSNNDARSGRSDFWDFYEKQQAKLLKENDKELFDELSKKVKSQDDFYNYVNEEWEKKTKIPDAKPAWGSFYELNEKNQEFLKNLINELKGKKLAPNSDEQKIVTLYDSYYNVGKTV